MGPAAAFDFQRFRHGDELIEINGTEPVCIVLNGNQHVLDGYGIAAELNDVRHIIRHFHLPLFLWIG